MTQHLQNSEHNHKIIIGGNGFYIRGLQKGIPMYDQVPMEMNEDITWCELNELSPQMARNIDKNDNQDKLCTDPFVF